MSSVVNVNPLDARNPGTPQAPPQSAPQRVPSGLRFDAAPDDAAGRAVAQRFTSPIGGGVRAARNANDGISLAQTAEGALAATADRLQCIRRLAVQALAASDRAALQTDVVPLLAEIDRVGTHATYAGVKLLDGSNPGFVFQVGADASRSDTISVSGLPTATKTGLGHVSAAATQSTAISAMATGALDGSIDVLAIAGRSIGALTAVGTSAQRAAQVVEAINRIATTTGVSASVDPATGTIGLSSAATIDIARTGTTENLTGFTTASAAAATTTGLTTLDVSSLPGAQLAIRQIDSALDQVDGARATLRAVRNRFTSIVNDLQTTDPEPSASRSRIRDAGFATETANLARAQILQQAGAAILAQANSIPNNVLTLLKG